MKVWLAVATVSLVLMSCKPSGDDSSGKSLDNFARGNGENARTNLCGFAITNERYLELAPSAKAKINRISGKSMQLRLQAASALTAVPAPIQTFFYGSGGRIILSDHVEVDCKAAVLTEGERKFVGERSNQQVGCWRRNGERVEVVLAADAKVIRHNTVRMFAYLYSQYFVERFALAKLPDNIKYAVDKGVSRFSKQRSVLASAFLADLTRMQAKSLPALLRLESQDVKAFENFVFAEALDSFFCSQSSHKRFREQFSATYSAFNQTKIAADFGKPWHR